jgi:hypothetical protein
MMESIMESRTEGRLTDTLDLSKEEDEEKEKTTKDV